MNTEDDLRITVEDKDIAQTQETLHVKEKNLSIELLLYTFLAMALGFLLLLPMIHIKNQIYYYSRDISVLWSEYSILAEENKDLRQKIETVRFKHYVTDTLDIK
jgi:cell division protein FtsL